MANKNIIKQPKSTKVGQSKYSAKAKSTMYILPRDPNKIGTLQGSWPHGR